ncbi:hypothetical protein F2Q68_00004468 [Brassica cretica]|uniref:Uncharacterized protein n=1 Tax=Brassica cretica TaxID=69181 RepID=A0A8S9J572_BRACR|nr:hypothetical protein F2Q68_00004468 [Brassica cretica]
MTSNKLGSPSKRGRRGERCLVTWTLPSLLPSRSAGPGICSGSDFRSPWLLFERVSRFARLGQDVFHCFALVFGKLLIEVPVGEQASLEGRDSSGDTAFGDSHLFWIEAGYVASQGFRSVPEDFVEAVGGLLQVHAAGELLHEFIAGNRKGSYGPGGRRGRPDQWCRRTPLLVLVSEGKILRFELAELLGALLQLLGVFVEFLLQGLELQGEVGIGLLPSSMQPSYLTLQIIDLLMEFSFPLGSFG